MCVAKEFIEQITKTPQGQKFDYISNINKKYWYWYQRYWPCIYLESDRYQNMQDRTPLA